MIIRKTVESDLNQIEKIYQNAKRFMRENKNPNQWNGERPNIDSAREDMQNDCGFVVVDNEEILAVFYFSTNEEPTYKKIYEGKWLNDEPYGVIHRIAVKKQGCGIIEHCINECLKYCTNLRIDTHRDNFPMQRALLKRGFKYCGIIYLENGEERLAYQKTNNGN